MDKVFGQTQIRAGAGFGFLVQLIITSANRGITAIHAICSKRPIMARTLTELPIAERGAFLCRNAGRDHGLGST